MKKLFALLMAMLFFTGSIWSQTTVQIGSGTSTGSTYPINSCFGYNYSQQIYLASELQAQGVTTGTINKIRFYYSSGGTTYANWSDWTIYIGTTTKAIFTSNTDWVPLASMTQVFSGTIPTPADGSWIEITLTTPFAYTGDNLVVAVDENSSSYSCTAYFNSFASGSNRGLLYRSDGTNPDPASPPTASSGPDATIAQVQFDMTIPACSGTPTPGNTIASLNPVCPDANFTLSLQNSTSGSGVSYQWESSADGITWTPITGATNSTLVTSQTIATYYHCLVTCSGNTGASNPLQITMNSWETCYCTSTSTYTTSYFDGFTTTGGATNISNPSSGYSAGGYGNFLAMTVSQALTGTVNFSTTLVGTTVGVNIWVDWNHNGLFTDAGEKVFATGSYVSSCSGSFTVPLTATLGNTRMRIRMDYYAIDPNPCDNVSTGETEDYTFTVLPAPSCIASTALTSANITATSAALSWTTGGASIWNIEYGPAGFTQGTGTTIHNVTNPYTLNGLTANTQYNFYVQDSCSVGNNSSWAGPASFTTLCSAASLPWTENFDAVTIPALPACWYKENGDYVTTDNTNSTSDADAHSGTQFLRETYSATNEYIWTPGFQLNAGTSYDFSFWWAGDNYATWTGDVFYNTNQVSTGATQLGSSFVVPATTTTKTYAQVINSFTPSVSGIYYFAIRVNAPSDPYYLSFDDFAVNETPSCIAPTLLNASAITASSASLSWTTGGSATMWNIEYGPHGFTPGTGNIIHNVTNPYALNGLTAATIYDFYVQDSCSVDNNSSWAGPASFTTLCSAASLPWTENFDAVTIPALPVCWYKENGDYATTNNDNNTDDADAHSGTQFLLEKWSATNEYIWTPGFQLNAGTSYDFSFWWAGDDYDTWTGDVFYNTSQLSTGATQLGSSFVVPTTTTTKTYAQVINSFTPSVSGIYYFAIRVNAPSDPYYLSFDDFAVNETPSCIAPTLLNASAITTSSASLSWTTGGSAAMWNIEYGPHGFTSGTGNIIHNVTNPYTLNGLTAATTYDFYVQDSCGAGDVSTWTGPHAFTTGCTNVSVFPFSESFDGTIYPPTCWSVEQVAETGNWDRATTGDFPLCTPHSGNGMSYFNSYDFSSGTNSALYTPALDLPAEGYMVDFWMYKDPNSNNDSINVYYNTSASMTGATLLRTLYRQTGLSPVETAEGWYEYNCTLPAGSMGNGRYVIFEACSDYGFDMYIDDVVITTTTGVAENSDASVNIMPNPTNGIFTIDFGGLTGTTNLNISDVTGRVVLSKDLNLTGTEKTRYDLSSYSKGIYNVRIINDNHIVVRKIVVD